MMLTEKYRPHKLDDVVGHPHIVKAMKTFVEEYHKGDTSLPHFLFSGPPGTGKTSVAKALAREIYGKHWRSNFTDKNASDDRGINVIRGEIKGISGTKTAGDASFRIIFLDECDHLTRDAQAALRRTMEDNAANCRFILSCNYPSKIIEPIHGRCMEFRFAPVEPDFVKDFLNRIAKEEKIKITDRGIETLAEVCNGDLRRAVNGLEKLRVILANIDDTDVYRYMYTLDKKIPRKIMAIMFDGDKNLNDRLKDLNEQIFTIYYEGYGMDDVLDKMLDYIMESKDIPAKYKVRFISKIADVEFQIISGAKPIYAVRALMAWTAIQIDALMKKRRG